jgi:biotin operon repressor
VKTTDANEVLDKALYSEAIVASVADDALAALEHQPGFHLKAADLCKELRCSERVLQSAVAKLQHDGHSILLDRSGYWLAERDEVMKHVDKLRRQARALQALADTLEASVRSERVKQIRVCNKVSNQED